MDALLVRVGHGVVSDTSSQFVGRFIIGKPTSNRHEKYSMARNPIVSGGADGPNGVEPLGERLVALSVWHAPLASVGKVEGFREGSSGKLYQIGLQFTPADHASLAAWVDDASHGYDRVEVEQGLLEDGSWAGYALIYRTAEAWATWGVMKRSDHLEMWQCATGQTIGCHAGMATALASLPHATKHRRKL